METKLTAAMNARLPAQSPDSVASLPSSGNQGQTIQIFCVTALAGLKHGTVPNP